MSHHAAAGLSRMIGAVTRGASLLVLRLRPTLAGHSFVKQLLTGWQAPSGPFQYPEGQDLHSAASAEQSAHVSSRQGTQPPAAVPLKPYPEKHSTLRFRGGGLQARG